MGIICDVEGCKEAADKYYVRICGPHFVHNEDMKFQGISFYLCKKHASEIEKKIFDALPLKQTEQKKE